jgi:hypothetical protein
MGCAVLLMVVGSSGERAQASPEQQGRTEATEQEQAHSGGAAPEEDRCEGTRTVKLPHWGSVVTNDVPGCPNKGGLLSGTDGKDNLHGGEGEDELHGLDGGDALDGGLDNDVLYGGPGVDLFYGERGDDALHGGPGLDDMNGNWGDDVLYGGDDLDFMYGDYGEDVLYGEEGNDLLGASYDRQRDKLYCGGGWDKYEADKIDYVSSTCEKGTLVDTGGPPLLLLASVALLSTGLLLSHSVIRRAS